jgi:hypothetical protein
VPNLDKLQLQSFVKDTSEGGDVPYCVLDLDASENVQSDSYLAHIESYEKTFHDHTYSFMSLHFSLKFTCLNIVV